MASSHACISYIYFVSGPTLAIATLCYLGNHMHVDLKTMDPKCALLSRPISKNSVNLYHICISVSIYKHVVVMRLCRYKMLREVAIDQTD